MKTINYRKDSFTAKLSSKSYVGSDRWKYSDEIYFKLTGRKVSSNYIPKIPVSIVLLPNLIPNKNLYGFFWSTPTFKHTDCHYTFHLYNKSNIDYIISTSSANTVEGMASTVFKYNQETGNKVKAILLVPEMSCFKVSKTMIENNPYVSYVVLKNSTLDSIRDVANELIEVMSARYTLASADADLKTAAYSQIGFTLENANLFNNDLCFVQTVSGAVGPAGVIESAYSLKKNPEFLVVQPDTGNTAPVIDSLDEHSKGGDPFSVFEKCAYETCALEKTLGSTRPLYAIKKFIKWRETGGVINTSKINELELFNYKDKILNALVKEGIYPSKDIALKFFDLEKSGFIAFAGAIKSAEKVKAKNIVVNFTGRYPDPATIFPLPAKPHIIHDPSLGINHLLKQIL